jgi:uncharacterized peroxidase-related enzyme
MSEFTIHTVESAPKASQDALAELEQNVGFIPNRAATLAGSPTAMQSFASVQSSLRQSSLTPVERELVGLVVSYANASKYSMAAHSTFAQGQGAPAEVVAALRAGEAVPDGRLQALNAFTTELLRRRGHVSGPALVEFLQAGYSTENVLEVITQTAYTTLANFVANVAQTPVDEAFEPQAWTLAAA